MASITQVRRPDGRKGFNVRWREGTKNRARLFDLRRDAEAWKREVERRRQLGELTLFAEGTTKTVGDLHDEWLATRAQDLSPKSRKLEEGVWRTLISPSFRTMFLYDVQPLVVERWARDRLAEGRGEVSVEKAWLTLSAMFSAAVGWRWVRDNPVRLARRPKRKTPRREPVMPSVEEVERLRGAMTRTMDATLVSVLYLAGLRPGEALALTWGDVGRTHIEVNKALSLGEVRTTKTGRSRRVPLLRPLRSDLLQWRFRSAHHFEDDPVFPNFEGTYWSEHDHRAWNHVRFGPAKTTAGLPKALRPYDLRHLHASMRIRSGMDVVQVARIMGHAPTMTLQTYAHVIDAYEGTEPFDIEAAVAKARGEAVERAATAG